MQKKSRGHSNQKTILVIAVMISAIFGLLFRIPLNNIIGDEGIGIWNQGYKLYSFCFTLVCFGIPIAVANQVLEKVRQKEYINSYQIFRYSLMGAICVGLIVSLLIYIGANSISKIIFQDENCAIVLRILAPNIFQLTVIGVIEGYFQGNRTKVPSSISKVLSQIIYMIAAPILAYQFMNVHSASKQIEMYGAAGSSLAILISSILSLMFLLFILLIYIPVIQKRMKKDSVKEKISFISVAKNGWIAAFPIVIPHLLLQLNDIIAYLLYNYAMVGKKVSITAREIGIGIYSNKYQVLIYIPVVLVAIITFFAIPLFQKLIVTKDKEQIRSKIQSIVKYSMLISIPSAVGLAVIARPIVALLYQESANKNITAGANLLRSGSFATVTLSVAILSIYFMIGLNEFKFLMIHFGIAQGIHIVFVGVLLFATKLDLYALMIGTILYSIVLGALNYRVIAKKISYQQELLKTFGFPFLASVFMGVIVYCIYKGMFSFAKSNGLAVLVSVLAGIFFYFGSLFVMRMIDRDDLDDFMDLI